MPTRDDVTRWVEGYRRAWASNQPDHIRALFTDDAVYYEQPYGRPREGVDAIVADWLDRRDEPGEYEFSYDVLAADGDVGVVQGRTLYRTDDSEYANLWVIRFADGGRARQFTDWWVRKPDAPADEG